MSNVGEPVGAQAHDLTEGAKALFGRDFLAFVLNGDTPEAADTEGDPRREVLNALIAIAEAVLRIGDSFGRHHALSGHLAEIDGDGFSLAHRMRLVGGGQIPNVSTDDEVVARLIELAIAAFPLQLLTVPSGDTFGPMADIASAIYNHKAYLAFARAVRDDPTLSLLFPPPEGVSPGAESFPRGVYAHLIWSHGGAGPLDLEMVAPSAIDFTLTQMRIANDLDIAKLPTYVEKTVALMRKLASTRRALSPCVAPLSNLSVEPDLSVTLGAARIVNAQAIRGHVRGVSQQATAVLVIDVELRLLDVIPVNFDETGDDPTQSSVGRRFQHRRPAVEAAAQALDRELTRARLAAALASGEELVAPFVRGWTVLNPLSGGSGGYAINPYAYSLSPEVKVDSVLASKMTDWGQRVLAHPDSMWMGARRLLSAMAERQDALDAFIDAVVCWENLLGADTEVTFRVSAGLAALLEPDDPVRRLEVFDEMRSLYAVRSGLIHGSKEPPRAHSYRHAQRAIRVAIDAMKAIYDRPELLQAPSSGVRNRRLLMGA